MENNKHLGQVISGKRQEEKNIDLRIAKARNVLFSLLGPCFNYKCQLNPSVKLYLYKTFICPILRSGLSTFVIKNTHMYPLSVFQRKTLKGILKLSKQTSTSAVHFLTGELPVKALIHRGILSLFYSVWINPKSKIYTIIKYLLTNITEKSKTS